MLVLPPAPPPEWLAVSHHGRCRSWHKEEQKTQELDSPVTSREREAKVRMDFVPQQSDLRKNWWWTSRATS
uniref:Uncharacterized protein n=1 Tax=Sphaerodactylus townsendi TaxID=933632 RepID=A0ACB8F7C1_9SAUR